MPTIGKLGDLSTGHDGFPPTQSISTPITTVFIDGSLVLGVGSVYAPHVRGSIVHEESVRVVTSGSPSIFFDGIAVARTGDPISCGDTVGESTSSLSID